MVSGNWQVTSGERQPESIAHPLSSKAAVALLKEVALLFKAASTLSDGFVGLLDKNVNKDRDKDEHVPTGTAEQRRK